MDRYAVVATYALKVLDERISYYKDKNTKSKLAETLRSRTSPVKIDVKRHRHISVTQDKNNKLIKAMKQAKKNIFRKLLGV
jgi:hypothetical protein